MKTTKALSALACFLLVAALLATCIDVCAFRKDFYRAEYEKNDTSEVTGMSNDDVMASTSALLDYLRDERQDIVVTAEVNGTEREVFNERETLHMVDVKALYRKAILFRNICAALGAALILFLSVWEKKAGKVLRDGFIPGSAALLALISVIGVWVMLDFNNFWTNFHLFFFDNDLWLLDPRTSIMINLFPETFFFDMVVQIILGFLACMIAASISIYGLKRGSAE
ncbi:MAG: TIGR01906 family membrane protein [Solobacterium sp.]|nr:TIGR01906 family membrane protein [Solobacterium sp.]